jgi:uncharacterized SAM-binding protein YcdF (DUF218 family)
MFVSLIKTIGLPGSLGFLCFGIGIGGLLLIWKRTRRLGRIALVAMAGGYLILSLPAVAQSIAGPGTEPAPPLASYGRLDEVFVIDGDNYQGRATTAAELAAVAKPRVVWLIGGIDLGHALLVSGVSPKLWRWPPGGALTTREQVRLIKRSVDKTRPERAAVVTSRLQAPRILALARQEQLDIVVVPAPLTNEPSRSGFRFWVPSRAALSLSEEALYERLALVYYRRNGWIS